MRMNFKILFFVLLSSFCTIRAMQGEDGSGWQRSIFRMNEALSEQAQEGGNSTVPITLELIELLRILNIDSSEAERMHQDALIQHLRSSRFTSMQEFFPCPVRDLRALIPTTLHELALELNSLRQEAGCNADYQMHAQICPFDISADVARVLVSYGLPVICRSQSGSTLAMSEEQLSLHEGAGFVPLIAEVSEENKDWVSRDSVIPHRTTQTRPAKGVDFGLARACFLLLSSLRNILTAFSQLAEVVISNNESLLAEPALTSDLKNSIIMDGARWSIFRDMSASFYPNLMGAFVLYQLLLESECHFVAQGMTERSYREGLMDIGLREDLAEEYARLWYEEMLIYVWIRTLLRPYVALFTRLSDGATIQEIDPLSLGHSDFARLLERYSGGFKYIGRKRARKLKKKPVTQAITSCTDATVPSNEHYDSFQCFARDRSQPGTVKKKSKQKSQEVTSQESWKERTQKRRQARDKEREKEREQRADESQSNHVSPQLLEENSAQAGSRVIWALWPSERDRFAILLQNEFADDRVFNAFLNPFNLRYGVTQREVNDFFERIGSVLTAFLIGEGRYNRESIAEFVTDFVQHGLGTDHAFHGSSHSQRLPPNYIAHRRGALVIFGVVSPDVFGHQGKDGRHYEDKYAMRLLSKTRDI